MKALIDPREFSKYISSWEGPIPIYVVVGQRVAQVEPDNQVFEVAPPIYWRDCPDTVIADQWAFVESTQTFAQIPENVEKPQPTTTGTQSA
jgi:hypothetical protein